ncbi:hypothetical protein EF847_20855 [Actinobacteria bacterium YIM 96077]|uniref:SARP family transcriptional regulator n=1 Tax=Phytoactinopolyspora halophila TaxID=1981511 RepID=A0A329QM96_9ACTN|nr:BTAD domain-containing putative transcriptional regulator [Phytoactinopolyspora halophila]AYY14777.1 hypothetical protein EF847_20855 [Actinobacteria bacterium YIM 96077]RAW13051.1 hypothetical protein DPM12_13265 [Phytoactinopolyspora halophila]
MCSASSGDGNSGPEIRLLGPVGVWRHGERVAVPTGRPLVLLATLALNPGVVVTQSGLRRYLWPVAPPASPRRTIQTYAARLRSALGSDVVHTSGDGLILDLSPEAIDLCRFRSIVDSASGEAVEPDQRLERLRSALLLWHGPPLSGLSPDALSEDHGPALLEELLGASERANELCLELDRADEEFVSSVKRLIADHPWRERLWGQLMRALYAQGRQGEALATFHELVGVLRTDLGIDPGAELTELHQRMLTADPSLHPTAASGEGSGPGVPRPAQLPPDTPDFVDRTAVLEEMTALLAGTDVACHRVIVSGAGGTGKTALALRAAHRVRESYPDGQLFADLRGVSDPATPHDVLAGFLRALGLSDPAIPSSQDERSNLFRSMCATRRLLLVLDNAQSSAQVAPLFPAGAGCGVIVTSRPRLLGTAASLRVDLAELPDPEARELLDAIVGESRLEPEPGATETVLRACGGSPLALRIAGGRLVSRPRWPVAELARQLDTRNVLDVLTLDDMSVRGVLDVTYRSMEPEIAGRFRLLAAVPGTTLDADMAAAVWNVPAPAARDSLERLCDLRLLESIDPETYRWHDLVGQYMHDNAGPGELVPPATRLLRHVGANLLSAKRCLRSERDVLEAIVDSGESVTIREFTDQRAVHEWLHPRFETITLLAAHGLAGRHEMPVDEAAAVMMLADIVAEECCLNGTFGEAPRAVLAADVPLPSGLPAVGVAWQNLAGSLGKQNRFEEAFDAAERARAIWRELGDRGREMAVLNNMAIWHLLSGRYDTAAQLLTTCIESADALSARSRTACLQNLASVYVNLGRLDDAERCLTRAHSLAPLDSTSRLAHYLALRWGQLHRAAGNREAALAAYERAADVGAALDSPYMHAYALVSKAATLNHFADDGSDPAARAVQIARTSHHPHVEAEALVELGHAAALLGNRAIAASYWREALRIFDSLGAANVTDVRKLLADA